MEISEEKILVFDADVIIHFIQADHFFTLRNIFPNNKKIILEQVTSELEKNPTTALMLANMSDFFGFIDVVDFPTNIEMMKEYSHLTSPLMDMGRGESACMSYCRFTNDIVVSSNLRDVSAYCKRHKITNLTTMDLVVWAYENGVMTESECDEFIRVVKRKGGLLPHNSLQEHLATRKV